MIQRIPAGVLALFTGLFIFHGASAAVGDKAVAKLQNQSGESVGTVELEQTLHGTLLHARLEDLPEGAHAFHIHETGKCEAPFKSAGGHFAPGDVKHGFGATQGPHPGDFPNIHVPAAGELEIEYLNTLMAVDKTLLDEDGAAIVIHEKPDDYRTHPAGDAGARIACGVIERRP